MVLCDGKVMVHDGVLHGNAVVEHELPSCTEGSIVHPGVAGVNFISNEEKLPCRQQASSAQVQKQRKHHATYDKII